MAKSIQRNTTGVSQRPADQAEKVRYSAFVVEEPGPNAHAHAKPFWHRVAPAYPHKNGVGFDIVVPPGVTLSGRITVRQVQPREDRGDDRDGD